MNIILSAVFVVCLFSFVMTIFRGIGISMIFNFDAFLIVIGGTTIALFLGFPINRIRTTIDLIKGTFSSQRDREAVIADILEISGMYGKTDVRSIENRIRDFDDDFMKLGVSLLINDNSRNEIRRIMEREMMLTILNYNFSQNLLRTVARLAPSFGLAGTVISLIGMFKHLESIDAIAPMMAMALMSTFYGVIIANLFMLPLCAKLKEKAIASESVMHITIDGILLLQNREHPLKIEEKLREYRNMEDAWRPEPDGAVMVHKGAGAL